MKDPKEILITFIKSELLVQPREINDDTSLFKEGILSSLDLVSLLDFIEREFGYNVPAEDVDFKNFDNVKVLSDYLISKIKQ